MTQLNNIWMTYGKNLWCDNPRPYLFNYYVLNIIYSSVALLFHLQKPFRPCYRICKNKGHRGSLSGLYNLLQSYTDNWFLVTRVSSLKPELHQFILLKILIERNEYQYKYVSVTYIHVLHNGQYTFIYNIRILNIYK